MSTNKERWYLILGAAGLSSAAAAVAYITHRALHAALPRLDGSRALEGLRQPVEVLRDRWGVPHIYAENEEDLFFAQGYVQAQDRLFQMDAQRRVGYGRLSEIAGPMGIATDKLARACGWHHAAEAQWQGICSDPETRALSEAFAAGVNAYIREGALPAEYRLLMCAPEPWQPRDGAAWGAVLAWGLSVNAQTELLRLQLIEHLGPEKAAELAPACLPGYQTILAGTRSAPRLSKPLLEAFREAAKQLPLGQIATGSGLGSNNWVLGSKWTETGRPILANDPHLPPIFPTLWYENHLTGGRYDVTGFTTPGVPGVIIGHNQHIAWGITNGYADVQDLFVERFHPLDRLLYESDGKWFRAVEHEEQIHVRGQRKPIVKRVRQTRHGPAISDMFEDDEAPDTSYALSLRWASHDVNNHMRALLDICRATSWADFRDAARHWAFPPQNVVYADTKGNIGYLLPGRIPIRGAGQGLTPAPGWRASYDWQGWIEAQDLPATVNPPAGYIVSANNHVTGADYPYLLTGEWLAPYRARRIATLIEELAPLDIAQQAKIQTDTVSLPTHHFVRLAIRVLDDQPQQTLGVAAQRALERLRTWKGDMRADAVEPALAFGWYVSFIHAALQRALGPQLAQELLGDRGVDEIPTHPIHEIAFELGLRWLHDGGPSWVETMHDLVPTSLNDAVTILKEHLGSREETWLWGRLHYVELHSYLARIPGVGRLWKPLSYPLGGDGYTVSQARIEPRFPPAAIQVIPSCRMVLDVGEWDNSVSTLPGGQSGHPASEHYQDSVEDWLQGKYHPMLYSRARIEAAAQNRLSLRPATGENGHQ